MYTKTHLVVLANHRQARLLSVKGSSVQKEFCCLSNADESRHQPLSTSGLGHEKGVADAHFFPDHTDFKEVEKERFAHLIAQKILHHHKEYADVILICEPKMLGLLRKELHHHKSVLILRDMALDAVDMNITDIEVKTKEILQHQTSS